MHVHFYYNLVMLYNAKSIAFAPSLVDCISEIGIFNLFLIDYLIFVATSFELSSLPNVQQ